MPKISVIVPVYNIEQYIERCLQSILVQTLRDFEIIVVNDCTTDNTMQYVKKLAQKDSRITIISHKENMGLMMTRRTGYMLAKGDFITFCDGDDYLPNNSLELLYQEAIKTKADIVSGNITYIKIDGTSTEWKSHLNYGNDRHSAMKSLLLWEMRHNLCSKLFKRTLLQRYQYETFTHFTNGEDGCLFYQLINNSTKIVQIDSSVYNYIQNNESSSRVRYKDDSIRSICITNLIRHKTTSIYPDLDVYRHQCITKIFYWLYSEGYEFDTHLNDYISDYKLNNYKYLSTKYFNVKDILKLWKKRFIDGPKYYLKFIRQK